MTNGSAVRALSFEELEAKFAPLIFKWSHGRGESRSAHGGIMGYDEDDFAQEVRLVLWKCQESFSPETKAGYQGRPSTFINFFIHAVENKFGKLRAASDKFHRPVTQLTCVECKTSVPPQARAKCPGCGGRKWDTVRGAYVAALDELTNDVPSEDFSFDHVMDIIHELPAELVESAMKLLRDEPVSVAEKRALRRFGQRDDLPPELTYAKHLREGVSY